MTSTASSKKQLKKIGEYELLQKIGEGGLAEIFLARQESLARHVAIKILHANICSDYELVKRFERESITLASISHPNIVHVIDRGEENGRYYFIMEYIEGNDFKKMICSTDFPLEEKLKILIQVLKGLDFAHKNGVIHRDIKPANILIDKEGHALIADFGIAHLLKAEATEYTDTGMVMGTYAYMSPEQKEDSSKVDWTTDLYAVGVMLYEVLTGRKPMGRFKLPSEVDPTITTAFDQIVVKALAQNPADRFQKAVQFKDKLLAASHKEDKQITEVPQPSSKIKSIIGNCSFLDNLRETPIGSTYLVEEKDSRTLYVIKKQNKPDVGQKEAKILSNLRHPNILTIHGAGGDDKKLVIVMDYAQGGSLADRLVKPTEWRKAVRIMDQIVSGLDFAHKNNIIHGNLKPENVLFDNNDVVKVTDFSLVGYFDRQNHKYYGAPERRKNKLADIYSAGVIFYKLLTNRLPTIDSSGRFVWIEGNRKIPEQLKNLVERMLKNKPSNRIQTFSEVQRILLETTIALVEQKRVRSVNYGSSSKTKLILAGSIFVIMTIIAILIISGIWKL